MAEVVLPTTEPVMIREEEAKSTLTPPASEEAKNADSSSDLSDMDIDQDDIGEIEPAYYYEGGKVPVFTPVSHVNPRWPWSIKRHLRHLKRIQVRPNVSTDNEAVRKLQEVHRQD